LFQEKTRHLYCRGEKIDFISLTAADVFMVVPGGRRGARALRDCRAPLQMRSDRLGRGVDPATTTGEIA